MTTLLADSKPMLDLFAKELHISQDELLRDSLRSLLEHRLRQVKSEIFAITGKYEVSSVAEMEAQLQSGDLAEEESWQDFQKLDHLEYKRDRLLEMLDMLP